MVLVIWSVFFQAPIEEKDTPVRFIGIPAGSPGLIIRYLADEKTDGNKVRAVTFSPYTLYDCCASATQYAMGSGRLDAAVMCIDAASALLKKDRRYMVAGPVILNSDVLVTREAPAFQELSIAVSQNRAFQQKIIERHLGAMGRPVFMLHSAVPFAYGRGVVQGAVVDITQALNMNGQLFSATGDDGRDMVTHVMVIKKTLKDEKDFQQFMDRYEKAAVRMQDRENLFNLMKTYVSADMTMGDTDIWKKMNVRFIPLLNSLRQE